MKPTARSIISAVTGTGLAVFTVSSALAVGPAASSTMLGFSFLALFGLLEITILAYKPARFVRINASAVDLRPKPATLPYRPRVPAVVEFAPTSSGRCAA